MENNFIRITNAETKMSCLINVSKIVWIKSVQEDGNFYAIVKLSNDDCINTVETTDKILYLIKSV